MHPVKATMMQLGAHGHGKKPKADDADDLTLVSAGGDSSSRHSQRMEDKESALEIADCWIRMRNYPLKGMALKTLDNDARCECTWCRRGADSIEMATKAQGVKSVAEFKRLKQYTPEVYNGKVMTIRIGPKGEEPFDVLTVGNNTDRLAKVRRMAVGFEVSTLFRKRACVSQRGTSPPTALPPPFSPSVESAPRAR